MCFCKHTYRNILKMYSIVFTPFYFWVSNLKPKVQRGNITEISRSVILHDIGVYKIWKKELDMYAWPRIYVAALPTLYASFLFLLCKSMSSSIQKTWQLPNDGDASIQSKTTRQPRGWNLNIIQDLQAFMLDIEITLWFCYSEFANSHEET